MLASLNRETPLSRSAPGGIKSGERVPSDRELAAQLVVAPLTVRGAYDELEAEGYLETQRRRGTFVAASETKETDYSWKLPKLTPNGRIAYSLVEIVNFRK